MRLRVVRSSESARTLTASCMVIWSSISRCSKALGTAMKRNAECVMMIASQFAVAARARNRARFSLTKLASSATRMRAVGVELQELARRLSQAMAGHDKHRLADQAEPLLLHD